MLKKYFPHEKFNLFGKGGGDALAEQFAMPILGKIPISEDTNNIADDGTPLILQDKDTPTKTQIVEDMSGSKVIQFQSLIYKSENIQSSFFTCLRK